MTLRAHGMGKRAGFALSVTLGLAALTSLPWYTAQLMPDIWLPAGILALYLLAFRSGAFSSWEKALLACVVAFAIGGHMATLALMLGLTACLFVWRLLASRWNWVQPIVVRRTAGSVFIGA